MKSWKKPIVLLGASVAIGAYLFYFQGRNHKSGELYEKNEEYASERRAENRTRAAEQRFSGRQEGPRSAATSPRSESPKPISSDSYQASEAPHGTQTVKSVDDLQKASENRMEAFTRVSDGPLVDMKARHVDRLLQLPVLEKETWQDPSSQNLISMTLVKDDSSSYSHYIVKKIQADRESEPAETYVQVANHLLVRFNSEPSSRELEEFAARHHLLKKEKLLLPRSYLFEFSEVSIERLRELQDAVAQEKNVETFDANFLNYPSTIPDDELFPLLWGLRNNGNDPQERLSFVEGTDIKTSRAWHDLTDCSSTPVAVLDTGIDPQHPDLRENILLDAARNFTSNDQDAFIDRQGHGTHVAGTIGAVGDNGIGIAGVCWKAAIIPIKVLTDEGFGTQAMMLNGLMYAAQSSAQVLNLSLGGAPPSAMEADAIAANTSEGKLLIVAAGNSNNDNDQSPTYPASYPDPGIISVAALHGGGDLAGFSNFGASSVHIAAPGQDIVSTVPVALTNNPENAYRPLSGTSMAAPHVAGAVALFWSYAPELSAEQVRREVLATADTGSFGKAIADSRMLNLSRLMDAVKAKAEVTNIESGSTLALRNGNRFDLQLATSSEYSDISSIEILHDDEVIGQASRAVENLAIEIPLGFSQVSLIARVTDSEGRVFLSEPLEFTVDIDKLLEFTQIDLSAHAGDVSCRLTKLGPDGESQPIFEFFVNSERTCQKLCEIAGPLAFSSLGEIRCQSPGSTLYINASVD